jgi:hypothetical protein
MMKIFFATGIIFVLIGSVMAANYSSSFSSTHLQKAAGDYDLWEVSAYFKAGEAIHVYCVGPANWTRGEWDIDETNPMNHRHVWFYIDDPNGTTTEFNTAWTTHDPFSNQSVPLSICYINVTVRGEGLNVTGQYPYEIGGTALVDGNYTVRVDPDMDPPPETETPPYWLGLERSVTEVVYPNGYLLPLGASLGVAGVIISAKAGTIRTSKKKKRNTK